MDTYRKDGTMDKDTLALLERYGIADVARDAVDGRWIRAAARDADIAENGAE